MNTVLRILPTAILVQTVAFGHPAAAQSPTEDNEAAAVSAEQWHNLAADPKRDNTKSQLAQWLPESAAHSGTGGRSPRQGPQPQQPALAAGRPVAKAGTAASIAANSESIYVLRGNELHQLDAATLRHIRKMQLPVAEPRSFAGPSSWAAGRQMPLDGPHNHRILSATSPDGLKWSPTDQVIAEPGSVPDAVLGTDGRVRVYFCNPRQRGITVGIEGPDGTWQFQQTNLHGADPNVLVLPSGQYRCFLKQGAGPSSIGVADSADGVKFGEVRTAFWDHRYPNVTDSDAFRMDDGWVMYISLGPRLLLADSSDGLKFRAVRELDLGGSVSDTIKVDGGYRMYFHCNPGSARLERFNIWSAFSKDGRQWTVEDGPRLTASTDGPDRLGVADPAVIRLPDGTYRMFYKSFINEIAGRWPPPHGERLGPPAVPRPTAQADPRPQVRPPRYRSTRKPEVQFIDSAYKVAEGNLSGWFSTGQEADIVLSAIDFNNTGGPLLFNHNAGIASDGARLLLADRNNNRVLVWESLPESNVEPTLVLGQKDSTANNPGSGPSQMNWPVSVAAANDKVVVADAYNHRVLVWNSFPTRNGQPADLVIDDMRWPWGVWTDGVKLVVSLTGGRRVLIWNRFPTSRDQPADLVLTAQGLMGTPRTITSNGEFLIVGDHNARTEAGPQGNFVWKQFPVEDDKPYDFFMTDPIDRRFAWLQGGVAADGRLMLLGRTLHIWPSVPRHEADRPGLSIRGFGFNGGDGSGLAVVGKRLYISAANSNKVLVYNSIPTRPDQLPDFAIGSPDIHTNTLETNFIISNPVPASDGKSLFVSSGFDRKLYVWKQLPDQSGARPDLVYSLQEPPWDNALCNGTLALAGRRTVYIWKSPPLGGHPPDTTFHGRIGNVRFQELKRVALDDRHFYLSDTQAGRIYVWEGIPSRDSDPKYVLSMDRPARLSSDGQYLVATPAEGWSVNVYRIVELASGARPITVGKRGWFNLPQGALAADGHLFVADTCFNRVHAWSSIEDALAGEDADVILGANDLSDTTPEIGREKLFWPGAVWFDGSYLWVGEFKFSERLLRFSIH